MTHRLGRLGRLLPALVVAPVLVAAVAAWAPARVAAADPVPACTVADDPAPFRAYPEWASTLLDTRFRVTRAYVPPNLVSTANAGTNGGHRVRRLVIADLRSMVAAARRDGVTLRVTSAYRSFAEQKALHAYYVDLLGPVKGALRAARAGHSEHQLGTALDIRNTAGAYRWLERKAWRFGFVISYPEGERAVSCYRFEPWHIRYLGRSRAAEVHASGLVLRAWIWTRLVHLPT